MLGMQTRYVCTPRDFTADQTAYIIALERNGFIIAWFNELDQVDTYHSVWSMRLRVAHVCVCVCVSVCHRYIR